MDRSEILRLLEILNDKMKTQGIRGEIFVYGGASIVLSFNSRGSTKDIDALFEPKSSMYNIAINIAEEEGLPKDWLNDAVKGFISRNNDMQLFTSFSNLEIYTTRPKYLFAMKCMACRLEAESNDMEDIQFLIDHIGIKTPEEAESIILDYFPPSMITPKTHFMLQEFFGK